MIAHALLVLIAAAPAGAQQPPTGVAVDSAFVLIRTTSVHRDRVAWPQVEQGFRDALAQATTLHDSLSAFIGVFLALDDVHSSVFFDGRQYAHYRPASDEEAARVRPLIARANAQRGSPESRLVENDVGYLLIPSIYGGADDASRYAEEVRDQVCELAAAGVSGWILDLRLNMGGNMHPMLTGLGPLIGDGSLGGIVDKDGAQVASWSMRDGINQVNGEPALQAGPPSCAVSQAQPIAVLLGPITMSSGQIVAVALAGRPRTRSFGETTANGYTTANQWMQLTPDLALNLSVGYVADRTGRTYPRVVEPDAPVRGEESFDDPAGDTAVRTALRWLRSAQQGPVAGPSPSLGADSTITQSGIGPVRLQMSESALLRAVGQDLVQDGDAYLGEGYCAPGSRLFPASREEIEILWSDTARTTIAEVRVATPGSPWRTARGVGIGTTLRELEELAGEPVEFSGFGWDYGGGTTWVEGPLHLRLRLAPTPDSEAEAANDPRYGDVLGDRIVRSDHPLVRQMTISVATLSVPGPGSVNVEFECR